ncbi:hypothetical protein LTS17_009173 [Exophiala oligosperma]
MATTTTREETHTIPNLSSRIDTTLPVTTEESVSRLMTATPCEYAANLPVAVHYVVVDEADWRSKGVIVVALFEVLGYDEEAPDADPMEVHFSKRKNWSVDAVRFKSPKDAGMLLAGLSVANIEWEEMKRESRADELNCDVQDL